jgi:hypothetical protein
MHVHLPKPLHGWREFAGEVGIIVLGVLIALGAEQMIEAIHARREVAEFRSAVDVELATDLAAYRFRIQQEPCVKRRLGELRQWLDADRSGKPLVPAGEIGRPSIFSFLSSVWKSSSPDVMNHLSLETRERYAGLYDFNSLVDSQLDQEEEIWRSLNAFNEASRFSAEDREKIADLAYRAKSVDELIVANYPWFTHAAADMGIAPAWGNRGKFVTAPDPEFCRPLFPSSSRS